MVTPATEFSLRVTVRPWPESGIEVALEASAEEREALRARADIVDLTSLKASAAIEKRALELVLAGRIEAVVVQTCVVTLQPITASMDVPFARHLRRPEAQEKMIASGAASAIDEDEADIDILEGDEIDIGEVIAEEFCLALDPYPRMADADRALEELRAKTGTAPDDRPSSPFEKLRRH